jgi:hypothetical protein
MKQHKELYKILSYVFFILPPFIWGLVMIYSSEQNENPQIISLFINIFIYMILSITIYFLIKKNKLSLPTLDDKKHLLFGFIGNITVYFYTFQDSMNIYNIITIYLVLLIILGVYYFLFSKTFQPLELWILVPSFLIIDTIHFIYTGCGFNDGYMCFPSSTNIFLYIIYFILVLLILVVYIYKILELKPSTIFKYINIVLVIVISFMVQNIELYNDKLFGTLMIALPFFIIIDFIVSIVNKTYEHKTLIFYIRTSTIFFIMSFLNEMNFFKGEANYEILVLMIAITYTSLFINILSMLLKIDTLTLSNHKKIVINHDEKNSKIEIKILEKEHVISTINITKEQNNYHTSFESEENITYLLPKIEQLAKQNKIQQIMITTKQKEDILSNHKYAYIYHNESHLYLKKI